ncbi:MAG: hypothetical protein HOH43_00320 [Candidatus Latescibacteria bacterium]|jgi:hypothetical protein|nr:hypothetical protein [Candidatus Latescibacterota bacterium]
MQRSLSDHFDEYQGEGYTVFDGFMPQERIGATRRAIDSEFENRFAREPDTSRTTISELLNHETLSPLLAPHVLDGTVLDFAEQAMGPFVQLDSFEITGFPCRPKHEFNQVAHWHRDAFSYSEMWGDHPSNKNPRPHPYTAPTACNCLTYLQDMTPESGTLRVIPGSHLDFTIIPTDKHREPHPRERCLSLKAGDMVFTHNEILHAGSVNTTKEIRYFISAYFQRIGLPHRDRFDHANIETIRKRARSTNDRRVLRLFGEDPLFTEREQRAWRAMIDEDKTALGQRLQDM